MYYVRYSFHNTFLLITKITFFLIFQNSVLFPTNYAGFRRSFGDRLADSGVALQDIQQILRHREIKTTEKHYLNMYKNKLINEMNEKLKK